MRLPFQTRWCCRRRLVGMCLGMVLCMSVSWATTVLAEFPRAALFPLPEALRPNVTFWKRIFAVFDTNGGVLHDASDVTIVYEVWYNDLPNDSQLRQSIIDEARMRYRMALTSLADGKRVDLSSDEERIWSMFQGKQHAAAFRAAAGNLRFQGGMRSRFAQGLLRSWSYLPEIEEIFASMGLPQELTMLPHVESSFENRALSKVGAAGIWQIMPATGRRFLRVDGGVDERLNIRQATIAAARLLRENYDLLGTWPLAVTAYNHGAYGMKQAVATVGSTDFGLIFQQYRGPLFGFASQNFYAEFLAAVEVAKNYKQYFDDILFQEPGPVVTIEARGFSEEPTRAVSMARYEALTPMGSGETRHLLAGLPYIAPATPVTTSPALAEPVVPPAVAVVDALPPIVESGTFSTSRPDAEPPVAIVTAAAAPIEPQPLSSPTPSSFVEPVLARTPLVETSSFATPLPTYEPPAEPRPSRPPVLPPRTVTPPAALPEVSRPVGREVRPPVLPSPPQPSVAAQQVVPQVPSKEYRVRPGETLSSLARRYNTTTTTLATLNKLRPNAALKMGQTLQVPTVLPTAPPPVLTAEKPLPSNASILAVIAAGKPLPSLAEATQAPPPVPSMHPNTPAQSSGAGSASSVRLPGPDERFQVKGETTRMAAQEQLSQYASWLDVPVQRLQTLNRLPAGQAPAPGTPVRLDFSKVSAAQFTQKRLQYQRSLEEDFLRRYRVGGVLTRKLKPGETLLSVSRQAPGVPLWLLQRYNSHLDANTPQPGGELRIPQVAARAS
ncbi:MAG: LysM peptidoglycan-binding domain-containing protein [Candidatus Tectimicrobiota bacterium]